jgi:nitrite reductase/ring-hydroxylating ferredoxin subunit
MSVKTRFDRAFDRELLKEIQEKLDQGLLPQWLQTDPDIYEMELNNIFSRTWQFLGHESELKQPGDYVTRWMVNDPVLLVKTNTGEIKAFLNSCTHRGTHLCTADFGNKKTFTCPFHGWSFNLDGKLIGIVAGNKVYGEAMDKEEWALRPIPRVETYQGLIFGNLDPNAMSLEEYLGDLIWYWDIFLKRSDGGMEVRGTPQRWIVNTNWKCTLENFGGDPYHVPTVHKSTVELGISPSDPLYSSYGHQVVLKHGHCVNVNVASPGANLPPYQGMPEEMWSMFERNLSKGQLDVFYKTTVIVGSCFPNLSFHCPIHGSEGHLHNYLTLRVWRPLGPEKIEIWSWFLIDKAAPEELKENAYKGYISSFGPSGTLEMDDTEIWTRVVQASKGTMARDKNLSYNNLYNYMMGMGKVEPDSSWPGPGTAYPTCYVDFAFRGIHEYWLELLAKDME